ncbi:hypothetical protein [Erythrobacter aureus]|uniref:Uncharacterized protein n=1 Tax=Erythrobacter aureus TaxID=2182384 RepID=A0A345YJB6_9SPHN|nr:hypothetical protein [Erythrobacter aureus]AXK44018.1 hypothetical protein DVR09_16320 [Erythrobacter aureus]
MSDTNPDNIPMRRDLMRAEAAFKTAVLRIAEFEQPEGEGWALFNIPGNPTRPEDFLTTGIEACDETGRFDNDEDAYRFVLVAESEMHSMALEIHGLADIIRFSLWGDTSRRTPPDQNISTLPGKSMETMPCNAERAFAEMAIEEDDLIGDWIAEARVHAEDMPAIIQRDYLLQACTKLENNAVILARVNTLYDSIAHGDEDHRGWLKEAINNHMAGEDVPTPRGKGGKVYSGADAPIRPSNILSGPTPDLPPIMIICEEMDEAELEDLDDEDVDEVEVYYLRVKQEDGKIARIDFPDTMDPVTSIEEAVTAAMTLGYSPTHYISNGYGPWLISKMG